MLIGMKQAKYTGLSDWYLARLRQSAARRDEERLTPHSLVETDIGLIKDIVSRAAASREKRSQELLELVQRENSKLRFAQEAITYVGIIGTVTLLLCLFR